MIDHAEWDAIAGSDIAHQVTIEAEACKRAIAAGNLNEETAGLTSFMIGEDEG